MTSPCDNTQIKYIGDGNTTLFQIPFEYERETDIFVALWDEMTLRYKLTTGYQFENATTIRFNVAPPANPDKADNILIARVTNIDQMLATFYPGSNIRAQDLNDDFEQLRMAIQEGRCGIEELYAWINDNILFIKDIVTLEDQLDGNVVVDDTHVFSTAASLERYDVLVSENPGAYQPSQEGKWWVDTTEERISYWNSDIGAWVDTSQTGPLGPPGPPGIAGRVEISDNAPTVMYPGTPDERAIISGDLWLDSTRAILYVWYVDRTGGQWITAGARGPTGEEGPPGQNGQDGQDGQDGGIPEAPLDGEIYGRQNGNWVTNFVTGNNLQEPLELTAGGQVQINLQNLNPV